MALHAPQKDTEVSPHFVAAHITDIISVTSEFQADWEKSPVKHSPLPPTQARTAVCQGWVNNRTEDFPVW